MVSRIASQNGWRKVYAPALLLMTVLFTLTFASTASAIIYIPGNEITSRSAGANFDSSHILAIGVKQRINPNLSAQQQIDAINAKGGLAILSHPYKTYRTPGFSYSQLKWGLHDYGGVELTKLMSNSNSSLRYYGWDYLGGWSPLVARFKAGQAQGPWGFRNPDADWLNADAQKSSIVVLAPWNTQWRIMQGMKRGAFYSVRSDSPVSAAVRKSFPVPIIDEINGKITVKSPKGFSIRFFSGKEGNPSKASSEQAEWGTCSYTTVWNKLVSSSRQACASDNYTTTFTYDIKGGERYIKVVAVKYSNSAYPNAVYQPIFIDGGGKVTYNPYGAIDVPAGNKYLGAVHLHTKLSPDNPKGSSPAAMLAWFKAKGYDFISITDHNNVAWDYVAPKPVAQWNVSVNQNKWVNVYYKAWDRGSVRFVIKIKNMSTGKIVKTVYPGWKTPNVLHHSVVKADLAKGYYRYGVYTQDSSHNWGLYSSWKNFTVR